MTITLDASTLKHTGRQRSYRDAPTAGSIWDNAIGSDWPASQCGLDLLDGVPVDASAAVTIVDAEPHNLFDGGYQGPRVEQIDIDGRKIYAASVGYSEGYLYSLHQTQQEAEEALFPA